VWNEDETGADLLEDSYRDGTAFKDRVLKLVRNEMTGEFRKYAIPGRHRCVQCHMGSPMQNFILGFTPLQVNRRRPGEGGVIEPVGPDELSQVDRLIKYGVIAGVTNASELPKLEDSAGDRQPRNIHELRVQAYMVGNCAHCHNPSGFPVQDEPALRWFNLSPGGVVFQFPLNQLGVNLNQPAGKTYVDPTDLNADVSPNASLIYQRVSTPVTTVKKLDPYNVVVPHMPHNTPGHDCRAPRLVGRWIASIPIIKQGTGNPTDLQVQKALREAEARVVKFDSEFVCDPPAEVTWLEEDFTEPPEYKPRRQDWDTYVDPESPDPTMIAGIPREYRDIRVDPEIAQLATTPYPYGYWDWKPDCDFPRATDLALKDWMFLNGDVGGQPIRPLGEIYGATPGAAIFQLVCKNCHGSLADGNSGPAKALAQLSGGTIRVANLMQGLFGPANDPENPPGTNLLVFRRLALSASGALPAEPPEYGAAKYLVWMASGGTKVKFPPGFEFLVGPTSSFGGNMLTKVRAECSRLLPAAFIDPDERGTRESFHQGDPSADFWDHFCSYKNPKPPERASGAQYEAWKRRAQFNGGVMMYFFFKDEAAHGRWPVGRDHCESHYPRRTGP
jgi:mono/diheme cytochrome c family protein